MNSREPGNPGDPSTVVARGVAATAAAVLLLTAASVTVLEAIKYPVAAFLKEGGALAEAPAVAIAALGAAQYLAMLLALAALTGVLLAERRGHAVSRGLLAGGRGAMALLLAALLIWFGQAYLFPGQFVTGDAPFHVSRVAHFRYGLEQGQLLYWNNYWGLGVPFLQFTGPLFFWVGGVVDLVVQDAGLSSKLLLLASHLAAGWLVYLLARHWKLGRFAALVAALAFAGAWAHSHMIVLRGGLPQAFNYLLLPLAFLMLERLVAAGRHRGRYWGGLAAATALLLINHPSTGIYVGVFLALFTAGNLLIGRYRWADLPWIVSAGAAGAVASLFMVIPILAEQDWVTMTGTGGLLRFNPLTLERLQWLLVWSGGNTGPGSNFDAYLGLSVAILAGLGLLQLRSGGRRRSIIALLAVLMLLSLHLAGPHVRTVMVVGFWLALLAGMGVQRLAEWRGRDTHWPFWVLLILLLDLGLTAIQPLARTDKAYFETAGRQLESLHPTRRVLSSHSYDGPVTVSIFSSPLLSYRVPQTSLPHNYSATLHYNYGAVVYKRAQHELRSIGRLSAQTEQQLALLNVGMIANDHGRGFGMPDGVDTVPDPVLGRVVKIADPTPVVFAPRLERLAPQPNRDKPVLWEGYFEGDHPAVDDVSRFVDEVARHMAYDPSTGFAQQLMTREPPPTDQGASDAEYWNVEVHDYQVAVDRVRVSLYSERAGYARLAHAWYPRLQATLNGEALSIIRESTGLIVVPIAAGENHIEIFPSRSPMRYWLGLFTLFWCTVMLLASAYIERRGTILRSHLRKQG